MKMPGTLAPEAFGKPSSLRETRPIQPLAREPENTGHLAGGRLCIEIEVGGPVEAVIPAEEARGWRCYGWMGGGSPRGFCYG